MIKLVLLSAILHVSSAKVWVPNAECQFNLAVGAINGVTKINYFGLKEIFVVHCPEIMKAVEKLPEKVYREINGPENAINNLNHFSDLLKIIEQPFSS